MKPTCAVPPLILCMLTPSLSLSTPSPAVLLSPLKSEQLGFWLKWQTERSMVGQFQRGGGLDCVPLAARPSWQWVYLKLPRCRRQLFLNSPKTPTAPPPYLSLPLTLSLPPSCARSTSSCRRAFVLTSTKVKKKQKHPQYGEVTSSPSKNTTHLSMMMDDETLLSTFAHLL